MTGHPRTGCDRPQDRSEGTGQPVNEQGVRLLTDVLRIVRPGEVKVSIGTVLDRLTDSDPDRYRGLTVTELSARLRELEVMVGHRFFGTRTPSGERRNVRYLRVADVEAMLDRLDPNRRKSHE